MPANSPLVMGIKPWCPDMPAFSSGLSQTVSNVLPRTKTSYGPVSSLVAYASALPSKCMGASAAADPSGNVAVFAGTATDLYRLPAAAAGFTNVSKSAAVYTMAADQVWKFCVIKGRIIATNVSDPIQTFALATDTKFSDLASAAPKAKYCAGIKHWLMVANTSDPVGGVAPWRCWWSSINDPTSWPTPGSATAAANQSDYNDLVGENGAITGLVGNLGTADGALFFEHAVWRIVYAGPPAVFDFFPAVSVKGTQAPQSIVQLGSLVYYLGEDGFYVFDGTNAKPLGNQKVDKTFFADLDQSYLNRVCGAVDPINKMIFWAYPGQGNTSGTPNKMLVLNYDTGDWTLITMDCEFLFRGLATGYTLEGLDVISSSLDALAFSLDSRVWQGGAVTLGAFNTSHSFSYFGGSTLAATVDMDEIQPFNGQRTFVRNTRPLVDGGSPMVALGTRDNLTSAVSFSNPSAMNSLGWCPQRASGRYTRARVTMAAGSSFAHLIGVELDADPAGVR